MVFLANALQAQDTIALKIGVKIPAKIIRASPDTIVYSLQGSAENSKTMLLWTREIAYLRYANGEFVSYLPKMKPNYRQVMLKAGGNISQEMGPYEYSDVRLGLQGSVGYVGQKRGKKKKIALEAELGFIERGGKVFCNNVSFYDNSGAYLGVYNREFWFRLNYLSVNGLARYYFIPNAYIKAGLASGYLVGYKSLSLLDSWINSDLYKKADFKSMTAGIVYGVGLQTDAKRVGLLIEFVGQNDLTSIGIQSSEGKVYHNNSIVVNVGVFVNLY
jgi:hypothetical protein